MSESVSFKLPTAEEARKMADSWREHLRIPDEIIERIVTTASVEYGYECHVNVQETWHPKVILITQRLSEFGYVCKLLENQSQGSHVLAISWRKQHDFRDN